MQHAGGMLLPPVQKLVATSIFRHRQKMQTSPVTSTKKQDTPVGVSCFLVLDKGHVVEQGTHESLMTPKVFYRKFQDSQFDNVS